MENVLATLVILSSILISNILSRFLPLFSVPLIQILLGIMIAEASPDLAINLDPHTFLLIFIAPLLYNDGKTVNKNSLWKERKNIFLMAIVLVFVTVIVLGIIMNKMIPQINLATAFALAAALSPTDYVTVTALSKKIELPEKVTSIIEGEGLINDASGLVCFKFSMIAVLTGGFSLLNATTNFLFISIGGMLIGIILEWILIVFEKWINSLGMEDITVEVLLNVLTPFIIYIISEEVFKVSGVLAVVSAGMFYSLKERTNIYKNARFNAVSNNTWSILVYILNGLVFTLIGLQLPSIVKTAYFETSINTPKAIVYALIISLVLYILRYIWVYFIFKTEHILSNDNTKQLGAFDALLTSLTGVKGSVTLATVMSIPFTLDNGSIFPNRDLLLFLSVGVISTTILIGTFLLPILAKKDTEEEKNYSDKLKKMQIRVWMETIDRMKEIQPKNDYISMTIAEYKYRIIQIKRDNSYYKIWEFKNQDEKRLLFQCFNMEIDYIRELIEKGEVEEDVAYECQSHIENKIKHEFKILPISYGYRKANRWKRFVRGLFACKLSDEDLTRLLKIQELNLKTTNHILEYLEENKSEYDEKTFLKTIEYYKSIKMIFRRPIIKNLSKKERDMMRLKGIEIERTIIQEMFQKGTIGWKMATDLRKNLNYIESDNF
ncbi:MAG: Na+/H+ antiporter [Clostridioides sp.]|nr:Na+/H+ antiporter [Clostridioides sp.]